MNKAAPMERVAVAATPEKTASPTVAAQESQSPALRRAIQMADHGDCRGALQLLRPQGHAPEIMNAIGVCLMRLGKIDESLALYRGMVMKPGCTLVRPEVPTHHKLNFATALLLQGTPAGCLSVLSEIGEPENPTVQRLQRAMKAWEAGLSFWRRWDWRINRIEPAKCHVVIDFPPGEFVPQGHPPSGGER